MIIARRAVPLILALAVAGLTLAAKLPLDLDGSLWSWAPATTRGSARAKGLGSFRLKGQALVDLEFGPGEQWSGRFTDNDGFLDVTGTWSRKKETSRRLELVLSSQSAEDLADAYAIELQVALLSQLGINLDITLELEKSAMIVRLKPKKKAGTAKASINARYRFAGSSTGSGVFNAASKASFKVRGTSEEVALAGLLVEE
jgi:hypothetical protein